LERQGENSAGPAGTPLFVEGGAFERSAKIFTRSLYRAVWRCVWRGTSAFPRRGPVLLVSNHPSYLDPLCIYVGAPRRIHWMAWEALFDVPAMGPFIRKAGAFPVSDVATDARAMRTASKILKGGGVVGIFPEGGRSLPTGEMFPFLTTPFRFPLRFQCPVLPVTINGSGRVWPRGPRLPRIGVGIDVLYHPPLLAPTRGEGGSRGTTARAEALARKAREVILSVYRASGPILERSRREWTLGPADHPVVRAGRAGVPLLEWIRPNPQ
jgi:1-acyl-sn-glycerol-3-phosphate acyltransferase